MTLTLGELIDELEALPGHLTVEFGFCGAYPTTVNSYRGFYNQLAIGWSCEGDPPTVWSLSTKLNAAVGATFKGYKGGNYRMDRSTPVWVDNVGCATSTEISAVTEDTEHGTILLKTQHSPGW